MTIKYTTNKLINKMFNLFYLHSSLRASETIVIVGSSNLS